MSVKQRKESIDRRMIRRRRYLTMHRQIDYIPMSTSPLVRMPLAGVDHCPVQGLSIDYTGSQLYSMSESISPQHFYDISTNIILLSISRLIDN